ncbi:hypothetical protein GOV07_00240 [Candidatus Woesearchaeota archaeon]|nr:hypothetical protein [Candidatus Woesearchaeota archaeon]
MIDLSGLSVLNPTLLWIIPGAALFLLILITRNFFKLALDDEGKKQQRRARVWVFIARLIMISCIVIALAHPYQESVKEIKGNPRVTLLFDQSASTALMETGFVEDLAEAVDRRIPVTRRAFGSEMTSDVGSAILRNLEPGANLLLISDGNVNDGALLDDVAFYAATVNASISIINLTASSHDSSVIISGPGKVVADSEAAYTVTITTTQRGAQVNLRVTVDSEIVLDKRVAAGTYAFTRDFSQGNHRIEARILDQDKIVENNRYYKSVKVLPKPRILLVTKKSGPLELLLRELYTVEKRTSLPTDLNGYYAVVIDDAPIESLRNTQALHNYLIDERGDYYGNGFVLFGGMDSFDRGGYTGTALEALLPVKVGRGERKRDGANLVFILDMSGSTGGKRGFSSELEYNNHLASGGKVGYSVEEYGKIWRNAYYYEEGTTTADVIKAQAVDAIEQLKLENKVGIIAFGLPPSGPADSVEEFIAESVKVIEPMAPLFSNRADIVKKIPRITPGGPTSPHLAMQGAVEMLGGVAGDKNIILLTNGRYSAGLGAMNSLKQQLLAIASNARKNYGINFMTIGVGVTENALFPKRVDEAFMKELAAAGDGTYDRATKLNTLLIKWGDPKAKEFGQEFQLVRLSLTHFITRDLEPTAILNAYNEVAPKDTAELILAADSGQPALTTWRYGNGRVAAWTVFAGNNQGQLLNDENSLLVSRTVNWAIGDPQRKEAYFVDIPDVRTNEHGSIIVQSDDVVTSEGLVFSKQGNRYTTEFAPGEQGFASLLGEEYAVNRPSELDKVGLSQDLASLVKTTGGKVFKSTDADAIVEHAKEVSRRVTLTQEIVTMPFLVAAMLLLLLEITLRRVTQRRKKK